MRKHQPAHASGRAHIRVTLATLEEHFSLPLNEAFKREKLKILNEYQQKKSYLGISICQPDSAVVSCCLHQGTSLSSRPAFLTLFLILVNFRFHPLGVCETSLKRCFGLLATRQINLYHPAH